MKDCYFMTPATAIKEVPPLVNNLTRNLQTYGVLLGANCKQLKNYTRLVENTEAALPTHLFPRPTAHGDKILPWKDKHTIPGLISFDMVNKILPNNSGPAGDP